jgi:nucleoside-diphosphate-sugar epimerase
MAAAFEHAAPEIVFNLASTGVGPTSSDEELSPGNAGIVKELLGAADPGVTRLVIHAGSWSQYGPFSGETPIREDHPQRATTPYGRAKAEAEAAGIALSRSRGIPFVALRLFNVFGPGEAGYRLVPHIVRSVACGSPVALTSGEQIRDFVYVDDAVEAFMACAETDLTTAAAFNVATGDATSVRSIAEMASDHLGADRSMLRFGAIEPRIGEPSHVVGDASAFTGRTGWNPRVAVSEGVRDTVLWAMEQTNHDD